MSAPKIARRRNAVSALKAERDELLALLRRCEPFIHFAKVAPHAELDTAILWDDINRALLSRETNDQGADE